MAKILICNEKFGENFTANTSNRHLHLHIGAKVLVQMGNSEFALTATSKKVSVFDSILVLQLKMYHYSTSDISSRSVFQDFRASAFFESSSISAPTPASSNRPLTDS